MEKNYFECSGWTGAASKLNLIQQNRKKKKKRCTPKINQVQGKKIKKAGNDHNVVAASSSSLEDESDAEYFQLLPLLCMFLLCIILLFPRC